MAGNFRIRGNYKDTLVNGGEAKIKKALSMLLAVIMVLTLMVGCGDKNNNDNDQGTKTYPESFAGMEDLIAAA